MIEISIPKGTSAHDILRILTEEMYGRMLFKHAVDSFRDYTFVILGRPGPTGKTSLKETLQGMDINAVEIAPELASIVEYHSDKNHCFINNFDKTITIVLNELIK